MTDIAELALKVDATDIKNANSELDKFSRTSGNAERSANQFTSSASSGFDFVSTAIKGMVGAFAAFKVTQFASEAAHLSQRYHELGIVMHTVGKNAGLSAKEISDTAEAVRKSGISMTESRSVVSRLITANIDLADATKLARAAQDAAVIGQINSSEALDRLIHGVTSAQVEVLRGIGINVNFENSYKKLADEIGVSTTALSEQQKMQARVNVVLEEAAKNTGVYEASMSNAGKMMRSTERLSEDLKTKIGGLFDSSALFAATEYTRVLKSLGEFIDQLAASGTIERWGDNVARVFAFIADAGRALLSTIKIVGFGLATVAEQASALMRLDFGKIGELDKSFSSFVVNEVSGLTKSRDALEEQIAKRKELKNALVDEQNETPKVTKAQGGLTQSTASLTKATKSSVDERKKFIDGLQRELSIIGKSSAEIKKMEAARLGVTSAAIPLINAIESEERALKDVEESSRRYSNQLQESARVTESVMTSEERLAQKHAELKALLDLPIGGISLETYNRALNQARENLLGVKDTGKSAFDEIDQAAIQAARNIQTSLADSLLEGIKGFDNFAKSALNVVKRLAAEIASVKILQGLGLGGTLGLGATSAAASTGGGIGGALSMASLGSSAMNMIGTGFGTTGALASLGGALPGSVGAFFSGMAGGTVPGISSSAALAGSSFAAVAGPLAAAAALTQVFKAFAGDKRMGGGFGKGLNAIGDIPILSEFIPVVPLMNALFGRGPLKQKETNLIGDFTAGGFEGVTSTKFKAQGGAFVSDKVDRVITDTDTGELLNRFGDLVEGGISKELLPFADRAKEYSTQLGKFLDESITPISKGLIDLADNLGLGKNALDDFSFSVNIASEKGQALKDEQIAEIIGDASEAMARKLVPEIDSLKRNGESAYQAVQRVNAEFNALDSVLQVIGVSADASRAALLDMSIQQRSDLISLAGGVELLGQKSGFFFQNILTDADRLSIKGAELTEALKKFGVEGTLSVQQLRDIVLNNPLTAEQLNAAFDLAPLILEVDTLRNSAVEAAPEVEKLAEKIEVSFSETSAVVDGIGQSIQKLKSFVEGLKGSINDIIGVDSLTSARRNINDVLGQDRIKMNDLLGLSGSVQALGGARDTSQFSSRFDLIMSRAQDAQLVQQITGIAEERIRKLSQGLVTFLRGDDLPRFSSGSSFVPSTGPAIVHQGERIINPQQNQDLIDLLRQLVQKVSEGTVANVDLYRRLGNVLTETDTDGLALRTKAAT